MYLVGANPEAARLSGLPIEAVDEVARSAGTWADVANFLFDPERKLLSIGYRVLEADAGASALACG